MANIVIFVGSVVSGPVSNTYRLQAEVHVAPNDDVRLFYVDIPWTATANATNQAVIDAGTAAAVAAGFTVASGDKKIVFAGTA